ncbi:hypothetical protein D3C85_1598660 [compost metagenome]
MIGVLAVSHIDLVTILQITLQTVIGFGQRFGRNRVPLLTSTNQEVGCVSGQPELFLTIAAPQTKPTVKALHAK